MRLKNAARETTPPRLPMGLRLPPGKPFTNQAGLRHRIRERLPPSSQGKPPTKPVMRRRNLSPPSNPPDTTMNIRPLLLFSYALLFPALAAGQSIDFPSPPSGQVLDSGGWLGAERKTRLENELNRHRTAHGLDVLVILWDRGFPPGLTMEELAHRVGERGLAKVTGSLSSTCPTHSSGPPRSSEARARTAMRRRKPALPFPTPSRAE